MLPQRVPGALDGQKYRCEFAEKWMLSDELVARIQLMQSRFPFILSIFSGYRTAAEQASAGPTATRDDLSTHRDCPATGADLDIIETVDGNSVAPTDAVKTMFGEAAFVAGLRWGGGAPVDSRGIPVGVEWHHVDLGPRKRT